MAAHAPSPEHTITSLDELEQVLGVPHPSIVTKHTDHTMPLIRRFISESRFFVLATADANGHCDSSPRGDITAKTMFLDDRTLVIPDRPGNRRADSYRNILENPHVGILFVVPGIDEVVRINGTATLTVDPELLQSMSINGKPANLAVVVRIDEAFTHCARAILRSRMWDPESWPDPDEIPSLREMHAEQHELEHSPDTPRRQEYYRTLLY
ncbi:pyridoxamine 5'-phosphate oxidase family protein [Rhodococcus jostii]|uniref:Pyridoxamine 5'-phosphate oxidase N-terminal domain-containing protein n=1 Tax=Rhodococcus jostii TaxID=132919 RepID=A0A1H4VCA0_RHOJO|nr:pyridoxamine 5'-phosphate oxidase family protein [Rhodococcus jostii]SEC78583.1 hypothetical protein SAMN04490220_2576 [Rhodococcus jostii]